jgi:hypothetical protein
VTAGSLVHLAIEGIPPYLGPFDGGSPARNFLCPGCAGAGDGGQVGSIFVQGNRLDS